MLETLHLTKTYKPKKGQPVTALNDVSLLFPDTGMVFLLGKSGSGKSTLLNLLGGLDSYDSGEIRIKGASSRAFRQKHFDSYRNTYVGFIFQEYNLLDEFTVGANIALALQLQGKKATDQAIGAILEQVDLQGFGTRKPNELSGGQKQRVAIARALVKNPEIIMADEPTGALDSNTGKQVFDTLKKLSKSKLVIIVSHDREFAEQYADRIIELADGKVISDMEYDGMACEGISFTGNTVGIPPAYHLTEEDRRQINEYIDALNKGVTLEIGKKSGPAKPTDLSKIKPREDRGIQLIKSKLPMRSAFKMGANALKYKKLRLIITILLSCIAFGLFGLSDTFGSYNHINTCTDSIMDSGISYISVTKAIKAGSGINTYYRQGYGITAGDLQSLAIDTGVDLKGVFVPRGAQLGFSEQYNTEANFTETDYHIYAPGFAGYCEFTAKDLTAFGYQLTAGRLPDGTKNEIAITEYVARTFMIGGYRRNAEVKNYINIRSSAEMVGKKLTLDGTEYTVVGVVDTGMDISRYQPLTVAQEEPKTTAEELLDYALSSELSYLKNYSLHQSVLVGEGKVLQMIAAEPNTQSMELGYLNIYDDETGMSADAQYLSTLEKTPADRIIWLSEAKGTLGKNEIIVSSDCFTEATAGGGTIEEFFKSTDSFKGYKYIYDSDDSSAIELSDIKVVGYIDTAKYPGYANTMICSQSLMDGLVFAEDGPYEFAVGNMPETEEQIKEVVAYCYNEDNDIKFPMMNAVTYQLDTVNEVLQVMADVFLYIGLGFALFAAMLLANFISVSISYKKRDIGILRAIGSRSNDVFRIFFSESFIIAMINFLLSAIGVLAATLIINYILRNSTGLYLTVLHFGIRQILLLFAVSCLVAALASFLPVKKIASKRPIDAIRDK